MGIWTWLVRWLGSTPNVLERPAVFAPVRATREGVLHADPLSQPRRADPDRRSELRDGREPGQPSGATGHRGPPGDYRLPRGDRSSPPPPPPGANDRLRGSPVDGAGRMPRIGRGTAGDRGVPSVREGPGTDA